MEDLIKKFTQEIRSRILNARRWHGRLARITRGDREVLRREILQKLRLRKPKVYERLCRLAAMRGENPEDAALAVLSQVLGPNMALIPNYDPHRPQEAILRITYQYLWGLTDRAMNKVVALAELRGESPYQTWRAITSNLAGKIIPGSIRPQDFVKDLDFKEVCMVDHKTAKIVLGNGRVFYGIPSRTKYVYLYALLKDLIPKGFAPETYIMAIDASQRYWWGGEKSTFEPKEGDTVIECGAYTGFKAIRYADLVGPRGKVVAIEIGADNYVLMCRNIEANGLHGIVTPLLCGVWSKKGEMVDRHADRACHTLADVREKSIWGERTMVLVDTLENIMNDNRLDKVDLLNIQVNGAEIEVLEGLGSRFNDIKIFRVAAYYSDEKGKKSDQVARFLEARGATVLQRSELGSITAASAPYASEMKARLAVRKASVVMG